MQTDQQQKYTINLKLINVCAALFIHLSAMCFFFIQYFCAIRLIRPIRCTNGRKNGDGPLRKKYMWKENSVIIIIPIGSGTGENKKLRHTRM